MCWDLIRNAQRKVIYIKFCGQINKLGWGIYSKGQTAEKIDINLPVKEIFRDLEHTWK